VTAMGVALSIIMPCCNRGHLLPRILQAYEQQRDAPSFEVIAVDDASDDDTPHLLQHFEARQFDFRFACRPRNEGPAAARNLGLALARAPLVAFVGDDICPADDFVAAHVRAHRADADEGIAVLGKTVWPIDLPQNTLMTHIDGLGAQQFSYRYMHDGDFYDYRHLYTSNVSLKRRFLERRHDRFDTSFPYAAFEDAELGWRLQRRGMRIRYHAAIVASHYHYSTVWSFSERQQRCGQMSWKFIRKHPTVFTRLINRKQFRIILHSVLQRLRNDEQAAEEIEARSLDVAARHEWDCTPNLDDYYFQLLQYFYYKGLLDAMFAARTDLAHIHARHASLALTPALDAFVTAHS